MAEITNITNIEEATEYLREASIREGNKIKVKKPGAVGFFSACGIPEPAQKQYLGAQKMLIAGTAKLVNEALVEAINLAKTESPESITTDSIRMIGQVDHLSGRTIVMQDSFRNRTNPKTGESILSEGPVKIVVDQHILMEKAFKTDLVANVKAAMAVEE